MMKKVYHRRWRQGGEVFYVDDQNNEVPESVARSGEIREAKRIRLDESQHPRKSLEQLLNEKDAEIRRLRSLLPPGAEEQARVEQAARGLMSDEEAKVFADPRLGNKG